MPFSDINWAAVITGFGGAAAGLSAAAYQYRRTLREDQEKDLARAKEERRNDNTAAFAETAWTGFIAKLEEEIARKDRELHENRTEIARLEVALDKAQERVHNMLKRHISGKDVLQTDIGLGASNVDRSGNPR